MNNEWLPKVRALYANVSADPKWTDFEKWIRRYIYDDAACPDFTDRYPAHLHRRRQASRITQPAQRQFELTQEDFSAAMEQLNSYVDITTENLTELLELAKQHAERNITHPDAILRGRYYSNGKLGRLWSVRHVLEGDGPALAYRVVAGEHTGNTGTATPDELRQWARFEVVLQDNGRWVIAD